MQKAALGEQALAQGSPLHGPSLAGKGSLPYAATCERRALLGRVKDEVPCSWTQKDPSRHASLACTLPYRGLTNSLFILLHVLPCVSAVVLFMAFHSYLNFSFATSNHFLSIMGGSAELA